jgi:hypothetical protein
MAFRVSPLAEAGAIVAAGLAKTAYLPTISGR